MKEKIQCIRSSMMHVVFGYLLRYI